MSQSSANPKQKFRYAHRINGKFAKIARTPDPVTLPPMMPERALIKSSIYRANGALCRFTGEYRDGLPVFRHHNYATFTSDSVETVEYSQVREYLTGLALNNENEGAMNQ